MLRKLIWVPLVAIALLPTVAHAQFQQGDWTLTLAGSGSSDRDFDSTGLTGAGVLGYFFTDQIEFNFRQGISYFDSQGASSQFSGSSAFGADFHFDLDKWQPFLGAALGYRYGDGVEDDFFAVPEGGLKYFVNNTTYIFGSVGYQFGFEGSSANDLWIYALGIGFRW